MSLVDEVGTDAYTEYICSRGWGWPRLGESLHTGRGWDEGRQEGLSRRDGTPESRRNTRRGMEGFTGWGRRMRDEGLETGDGRRETETGVRTPVSSSLERETRSVRLSGRNKQSDGDRWSWTPGE